MIRQPASVIIAGPSGSGKSELVEQLLKQKNLVSPPPPRKKSCIVTTDGNHDLIV